MAEFKEELVINALHPEKAEVGKKYWVSDELIDLKKDVEKGKIPYELKEVKKGEFRPFIIHLTAFQFLYPYEEPNQRMTRIQFIEWVNKGNGIYKYNNGSSNCYTYVSSLEEELNDEVDRDIVIRNDR